MTAFRQGDVLLAATTAPDGEALSEETRIVLAEGESPRHRHVLEAGESGTLLASPDRSLLCVRGVPARLTHPEHDPIELEPGWYRVVLQREYVPSGLDDETSAVLADKAALGDLSVSERQADAGDVTTLERLKRKLGLA